MALKDEVKKDLRLYSTAYDDEVEILISEAQADLNLSGLTSSACLDSTDVLVGRAIKLYARANFGLFGEDVEIDRKQYEKIKSHLSMNVERNTEV